MRYPIFSFDGDDFSWYTRREEHWNNLEVYDVDYPDVWLDCEGRLLQKRPADGDRVEISDVGGEPDPERLRRMLLHALRGRGQDWADDALLSELIPAALEVDDRQSFAQAMRELRRDLGQGLAGLLSRFRLR